MKKAFNKPGVVIFRLSYFLAKSRFERTILVAKNVLNVFDYM